MADWHEDIKERFRVNYDSTVGVFRILDLWNESVVSLPIDATIPDDSPAVKTLSTLEINALLGKLKQMGWIEKMFGQGEATTPISSRKEIKEVAIENITKIVELAADAGISKEAIGSIREVANATKEKYETTIDSDAIKDLGKMSEDIIDIVGKKKVGRPRKE